MGRGPRLLTLNSELLHFFELFILKHPYVKIIPSKGKTRTRNQPECLSKAQQGPRAGLLLAPPRANKAAKQEGAVALAGWWGRRSLTFPPPPTGSAGAPTDHTGWNQWPESRVPHAPPLCPWQTASRSREPGGKGGACVCGRSAGKQPKGPPTDHKPELSFRATLPPPKNLGWGENTKSAVWMLFFHLWTSRFSVTISLAWMWVQQGAEDVGYGQPASRLSK